MSAEYTETTINPGSFPPPVDAGHRPQAGLPTTQQMKQRNGVLVWIVRPVLTLGIYHFVWYSRFTTRCFISTRVSRSNPLGRP